MEMSDLQKVKVTDELRVRIRDELLPELDEIKDPDLRAMVVEAWAVAIAHSSFNAIGDMRAGRDGAERETDQQQEANGGAHG